MSEKRVAYTCTYYIYACMMKHCCISVFFLSLYLLVTRSIWRERQSSVMFFSILLVHLFIHLFMCGATNIVYICILYIYKNNNNNNIRVFEIALFAHCSIGWLNGFGCGRFRSEYIYIYIYIGNLLYYLFNALIINFIILAYISVSANIAKRRGPEWIHSCKEIVQMK